VIAETSVKAPLNIRQAGAFGADMLAASGSPSPWLDCQLLLAKSMGATRERLMAHPFDNITESQWLYFQSCLTRREQGEPIAYILGEREFYGLSFRVDSRVLVPRPETETLVDRALELAGQEAAVLEIGTGSGCVAVAMAIARPGWEITATDISEHALEVARENAKIHGVDDRISFLHADMYPEGKGRFDLLVSNPPYVSGVETVEASVHKYEPHMALYSEDNGLAITAKIISLAPSRLTDGGAMALETGLGMSARVAAACQETGFFMSTIATKDIYGVDRVVSALGPEWTK